MLAQPVNILWQVRLAIAVFFGCVAGLLFVPDGADLAASAQTRRRSYSQFPHSVKAHQLECASCHKFPSPNWNKVRTGSDAFPDITEYPRHESCLNCHRAQFFRGNPPAICTICHVNPSPRDSRRHPFPNPREIFDQSTKGKIATSDFVVSFPHDKHIDIVSSLDKPSGPFMRVAFSRVNAMQDSCSVCHVTLQPQGEAQEEYLTKPPADVGDKFWLKRGTFKSVPIGHTTCFNCHSQDSGLSPAPTSCNTCHKLKPPQPPADFDAKLASRMGVADKPMLDLWSRRISAGTFRHEWFSHAELSCSTCHNVNTINTADHLTTKVPVTACAACHATATADEGGVLNYEVESRNKNKSFQCTKCHIVFGSKPIPESHLKALRAATGKQ